MSAWDYLRFTSGEDAWERLGGTGDAWENLYGKEGDAWQRLINLAITEVINAFSKIINVLKFNSKI